MMTMLALLGCSERAARAEQQQPKQQGTTQKRSDDPAQRAAGWQPLVDPGAANPEPVERAIAVLHPTQGNDVRGTVEFRKVKRGLQLTADVQGLPPGEHAYHVHLLGDCSGPQAKTAGTHFNFEGSSKNPPEDIDRITGDLGELKAGQDGKARASTLIESASLEGPYSILSRSVVVHERGNDPTEPPIGAAGGRLACGVIGLTEEQ